MGNKKRDKQRQIEERRDQRKKDRDQKRKYQKKRKGAPLNAFKLSKQYVEYFNRFNKQIAMLKIQLRDVGGDGNCLFRAFADQIDGNQTAHIFMRKQACKHIMQNQDFFIPFIDEDQDGTIQQYVKGMSKDGEWGGHFQLQALSECFRCIMVIHKLNLQQVIIRPMAHEPQGGLIHLAYFQHQDFQHYLSIRDIQDQEEQPAEIKLKVINKNLYQYLLHEEDEEYMMMRQIQEMEIRDKMEGNGNREEDGEDFYQEEEEPFPNYPRNKKCKCGSKIQYKNCCFKDFQRRRAAKGY